MTGFIFVGIIIGSVVFCFLFIALLLKYCWDDSDEEFNEEEENDNY